MIPEKQIKAILDRTEEVMRNMKYTQKFEIVIKASLTEESTVEYMANEFIVDCEYTEMINEGE